MKTMPQKLIEVVNRSTQKYPDKIALITPSENLTYSDLQEKIDALSSSFYYFGLKPKDRVALILSNCVEFIVSFFAISKLGGVVVPINPAYKEEMSYIFQDAGVSFIIASSKMQDKISKFSSSLSTLKKVIVVEEKNEALEEYSPVENYNVNKDDCAVIIYTNAYRGYPLGAMLTHYNLIFDAEQSKKIIEGTSEDRFISALPFFHAFGLTVNVILSFLVGGSTIIIDRFLPQRTLEIIEKEKPTIFVGVPAMFGMMSFAPGDYDISSVRLWLSGGAKLTEEVREKFEERFKVEIREGYGITEASPVSAINRPQMKNKINSIGVSFPEVDIKIVDEEGRELPRHNIGEVIIRGDNVMKGYYQKEKETEKFLKDGWLYTGDLGYIDEDDYIFLVGVKKEMLNCGGFNIYKEELKRVILSYPKIEEVKVGYIEDVLYGQFPKVDVKLKAGETATPSEITNFCKEKLASYKVPKEVIFL